MGVVKLLTGAVLTSCSGQQAEATVFVVDAGEGVSSWCGGSIPVYKAGNIDEGSCVFICCFKLPSTGACSGTGLSAFWETCSVTIASVVVCIVLVLSGPMNMGLVAAMSLILFGLGATTAGPKPLTARTTAAPPSPRIEHCPVFKAP